MKYTEAELLALDPQPHTGKTEFDTFPAALHYILWLQVDGVRCYNLTYDGGADDISVRSYSSKACREVSA